MLRGVLMDGKVGVNVITILALKYIGPETERPSSISLKMTNKKICKPQSITSNMNINILGIFKVVEFHVVLKDG